MLTKKLSGTLEALSFTDTHGARHLQVRIGRAVVAAWAHAFSLPLPRDQCPSVLDIGRGMCGYPVGVTLFRRWHLSLTAGRHAPGERLEDDFGGSDDGDIESDVADLIALGLIQAHDA